MVDWRKKLDAFLQFNDRNILTHAGQVAMNVAKQLAEGEYEKFHTRRLAEEAKDELDADVDSLRKRIEPAKLAQEIDINLWTMDGFFQSLTWLHEKGFEKEIKKPNKGPILKGYLRVASMPFLEEGMGNQGECHV